MAWRTPVRRKQVGVVQGGRRIDLADAAVRGALPATSVLVRFRCGRATFWRGAVLAGTNDNKWRQAFVAIELH